MSRVGTLRVLIRQRLSAAAEEIFELFEKSLSEYEDEVRRQRTLLNAVFKPEVRLQREDVQQWLERIEEVPPQQLAWRSSVDRDEPPEPPNIKKEREELWTNQEGEQPEEQAATTKFSPVKSEEEEHLQLSHLHHTDQMKREACPEDCGGAEPARNSGPEDCGGAEPARISGPEDCGGAEPARTSGPEDCGGAEPARISGPEYCGGAEPARTSGPDGRFQPEDLSEAETEDSVDQEETRDPLSCSVCYATFRSQHYLSSHMNVHVGERPFSCSVCGKRFLRSCHLKQHLSVHTKEKPFGCSFCGKRFFTNFHLKQHLSVHKRKKTFSCSVCGKIFPCNYRLKRHLSVHTGERPYLCIICGKTFATSYHLRRHFGVHREKKPHHCHTGDKRFPQPGDARNHRHVGQSREVS